MNNKGHRCVVSGSLLGPWASWWDDGDSLILVPVPLACVQQMNLGERQSPRFLRSSYGALTLANP